MKPPALCARVRRRWQGSAAPAAGTSIVAKPTKEASSSYQTPIAHPTMNRRSRRSEPEFCPAQSGGVERFCCRSRGHGGQFANLQLASGLHGAGQAASGEAVSTEAARTMTSLRRPRRGFRGARRSSVGGAVRPNPSLEGRPAEAGRLGRAAPVVYDAPCGQGVLPRRSPQLER